MAPYVALFERADKSGDGKLTMKDIVGEFDEWQQKRRSHEERQDVLFSKLNRMGSRKGEKGGASPLHATSRGMSARRLLLSGAGGGGGGGGSRRRVAVQPLETQVESPMEATAMSDRCIGGSPSAAADPASTALAIAVPAAGPTATATATVTANGVAAPAPNNDSPNHLASLPPLGTGSAGAPGNERLPPLPPLPHATTYATMKVWASPHASSQRPAEPLPPLPKHVPHSPGSMRPSLDSMVTPSLSRLPAHSVSTALRAVERDALRPRPPPGRPPGPAS